MSQLVRGRQRPLILGHEVCGIVVAKGAQVTHLSPGDRVAVGAGMWCGTCSRCREGRTNICEHYAVYGLHRDGGMAERALFPANMCVRVPANCTHEAAAMAQPLAVALHALARSQLVAGMRVAIFGVGGLGSLLLAAISVQRTYQPSCLIAIDIDPARLAKARTLGASATIDACQSDTLQQIKHLTSGEGVDLAIEVTGQPASIVQALLATRKGGRLLQVGIPSEPVSLPMEHLVVQEKEIITTNGHICQTDLPAALDLLATTDLANRIDPHCISLDHLVEEGLLPLAEHRASGKVIVMIGKPPVR